MPLQKKWLHVQATKGKAVTTDKYTGEEKSWDKLLLKSVSMPHYMQASAWGELKAHSQWPVSRLIVQADKSVLPLQVFSRTVPGLGRLHYAPEVVGVTKDVIPSLTNQLSEHYGKGLAFKLELYQPYSDELLEAFRASGWVKGNSVQHRHTVVVDLQGSEQELFARIKKRARYEVRVAQRNDVRIEKVEATRERLDLLANLMQETAKRSGAFFRKSSYVNKYWHSFSKTNQGSLYLAWHESDLLAGAYVISYGKTAWYKDSGSVRHKSNFMASRLLQWEIMCDLQSQGVAYYDLSGIPAPENVETSSMKGLYAFKTGFSKTTTRLMPAIELPFGKRYSLWPKVEPELLRLYSGFRKDFWY